MQGFVNTHVLIPAVSRGVDCGLGMRGHKIKEFGKAIIGNMYICGEIINEDQKKIIAEYGKRKFFKIRRFKKG